MSTDVPSAFVLINSIDDETPLPDLTAAERGVLFLNDLDPDRTEILGPIPHKLQVLMVHATRYNTRHNDAITRLRAAKNQEERATACDEHDQLCTLLHLIYHIIGDSLEIEAKACGNYQAVGVSADWQLIGKEPCQPDASAKLAALLGGVLDPPSGGMHAAEAIGDDDALVVMMALAGTDDRDNGPH